MNDPVIVCAAGAVLEVCIRYGCGEHKEGAMRVLMAVMKAKGMSEAEQRVVIQALNAEIDMAYD